MFTTIILFLLIEFGCQKFLRDVVQVVVAAVVFDRQHLFAPLLILRHQWRLKSNLTRIG